MKGKTIGLVPTMGALHDGHISLVNRARAENDVVVASVFVNPTQFGPGEDFEKYPRDIGRDMEMLQQEGADILFKPGIDSVYPAGFLTCLNVRRLSDKLCGAFRPGHFEGVATVVCKLFNICKPTRAYFGQKDFQQTVIIKKMIDDLNMDIEMVIGRTIRENGGLAMSSRNAYLKPEERKAALAIYGTLQAASAMIKSGGVKPDVIKKQMNEMLLKEPLVTGIQYAGVYDTSTLDELSEFGKHNLLAIALRIGSTRLIDNLIVEL